MNRATRNLPKISWHYIARNLAVRRSTTLLTAGGMALVTFVFAAVLMMAEGLRETLAATGADGNAVAIRKSAQTEVQSSIDRAAAAVIAGQPEIATGADGRPLLSAEPVVLIALPRRDGGRLGNVVVRGTGATGLALRPQARIVEGRMFRPGLAEVVVGRGIARGFAGAQPGDTLRFGQRDWTVVGVFDAGHSGFDSEVWGDAGQMLQAFRRPAYSSLLFRLRDADTLDRLQARLDRDPRTPVELKPEAAFYGDQSAQMTKFIRLLGTSVSVVFSLGAIIGAMITMYAGVANRTQEIGTLRALGYTRRSVMASFLAESVLLGVVGGATGLLAASGMQFMQVTTTNFQTFSDVTFRLRMNGDIALDVMLFALLMGFVGGFLPAVRAARLEIVEALRAA